MRLNDKHTDIEGLIKRYETTLSQGRSAYYDVDELEDMSEYYLSKGKNQESGDVIELGLKLHPNNSALLLQRATLFVEIGDYAHALHILERLPEKETQEISLLKSEIFLHTNRKEEGIALLSSLFKDNLGGSVELTLDIADILSDHELYDLAIEFLLIALDRYGYKIDLLEELAWCYEQLKAYDKATSIYEKILDLDPYKAEIWFNLGQAWFNLEKYNQAVEAYDFALTINAHDLLAHMQKAHALFQGGRYVEAAESYKEYMEADEVTDYVLVFLAESYEKAGMYEEACHQFEKACKMNPENIDALIGLALCLMELKEYQQSLIWFEKALRINEEDPEIWVYIGELFVLMEMRNEAFISYQHAISLNKDQPDVLASMGNLAFDDGDFEKALGLYLMAATLDPDIPGLNLFFALTYHKLDMPDLAGDYLEKAINLDPNSAQIFNDILTETD